jgi:hypothetical protein
MAGTRFHASVSSLAASALLAGCAGAPLLPLKGAGLSVAESESTTAPTLLQARKQLFTLRAAYREAMAEQLNATQMSSSTLVGLGVLVAGLAAGKAHPDAIVAASLIGGGSFAVASLTLDRRRVLAFDAGIRALDCAHSAVIPLDLDASQLKALADGKEGLVAARIRARAATTQAQSALDAAKQANAVEPAGLASAEKSIGDISAALTEADKTRKAADKLATDTREIGHRLQNIVLGIAAKVDGIIAATVPDVAAVQQVLAGLGGFASAFTPGAGIDKTLADALKRYNQAAPEAAMSANEEATKLKLALKDLDAAAAELVAATTTVNEALAPVDGAAVASALKACNVADVVLPLALEPATLALEARAGAGKGFAISGGSKPYSVRLLDAATEGLAISFAGGLSDTAIVAANDKVPADSYRVLVNDAVGNSRQLVVNVSAKAEPSPASAVAPAADLVDKVKALKPMSGAGFEVTVLPETVRVVGAEVRLAIKCIPPPAADKKLDPGSIQDRLLAMAVEAGAKRVAPNPLRIVDSADCVK